MGGRWFSYITRFLFLGVNEFSIVDVTLNFPENWKRQFGCVLLFLHYFEDYYLWEVYSTIEVLSRGIMDVIATLIRSIEIVQMSDSPC